MRWQTHLFVEKFLKEHGTFKKVLDIGSGDVNGNIKNHFEDVEYTGVDYRPGPNVNMVVNGHNLSDVFKQGEFDLVMSFDTFEHDDAFWLTAEQMKYVLRPGGYMLLGFPGRNCPEHDHPHDYWRFMPQSIDLFFKGFDDLHKEVQKDDPAHEGEDAIYMWGRKI